MVEKPDSSSAVDTALAWLVIASVVVIPLVVAPDLLDRFRIIKESAARAEAFLGLFLLIVIIALRGTDRLREMARERRTIAIVAAGVAWAGITSLTSTHRALSAESFVTILTCAIVFFLAWYVAPRVRLTVLDVLVPGMIVNAVLAAMQEYGIYNPFTVNEQIPYRHLTATGLIGNPNVVGTYMALTAICLASAAPRVTGLRRWWYAFGALVGSASVLVSGTRTAVIALVAGAGVLAIGGSVRRFAAVVLALAVLVGAGWALHMRVVMRLIALPQRIATDGLESATSGRITPALAALQMFRDHPVTGVGPGAFKYQYMPYHIRVRSGRPTPASAIRPTNFGETHNDHLQILAEGGLPGYLLFAAIVAMLALRVARGDGDARGEVARALVLPLLATFLLLCLAQFPLHVAITRQFLVTMAGLMLGWTRS